MEFPESTLRNHVFLSNQLPPVSTGYWPLTVTVEGIGFNYRLTDDDIQKVFCRYGQVVDVQVKYPEGSSAIVSFAHYSDAQSAIYALDGKSLGGVQGTLRVLWGAQPMSSPQFSSSDEIQAKPSPPYGDENALGLRKFTCRFEIPIENDKDFQVARRIIGQKGNNMKRIVAISDAKLRLRGKGSGYLEGFYKAESPEPLHLCVSCTTREGFDDAVAQVTHLLEGVLDQYTTYCKEKNMHAPQLAVIRRDGAMNGTGSLYNTGLNPIKRPSRQNSPVLGPTIGTYGSYHHAPIFSSWSTASLH